MGGRYKFVFWGALFIAAAATFGAYRLLDAKSNAAKTVTRSVVLAARDIPEGQLIDKIALVSVVWPVNMIPAGAYASIDSVAGRVARVPVFTGEAMVPGRLAPSGTGPGLEIKIPPGQRAMAVRINDVAGISGLLQPNSRVDVLVVTQDVSGGREDGTGGRQVAKLFMENMRVLSVGAAMTRGKEGEARTASTVTLGVTPDEAERLAVAMNTGQIQLVLRGYGDPDSVRTRGATTADVLRQMQGAPVRTVSRPSAPTTRRAPAASKPAAPAPVIVVQRPPPPPDSVVVQVYRAGKSASLKFDTAAKK